MPKISQQKVEILMRTSPETLAQQQREALKSHISSRLQKIANLINKGDYETVRDHLAFSCGDSGHDHHYINMTWLEKDADGLNPLLDIEQAVVILEGLEKQIKSMEQLIERPL